MTYKGIIKWIEWVKMIKRSWVQLCLLKKITANYLNILLEYNIIKNMLWYCNLTLYRTINT